MISIQWQQRGVVWGVYFFGLMRHCLGTIQQYLIFCNMFGLIITVLIVVGIVIVIGFGHPPDTQSDSKNAGQKDKKAEMSGVTTQTTGGTAKSAKTLARPTK